MDSENWNEEYSDEDSYETATENIDINQLKEMENIEDNNEKILLLAESIFDKIKFYCDYHGLNMLNVSRNICIENLRDMLL